MPLLHLTSNGLTFTVANMLYCLSTFFLGITTGYLYGLHKAKSLNPQKNVDLTFARVLTLVATLFFSAVVFALKY